MIAAALLLAGTLVLPGAGAADGARQGGPVEREWRIRTLAHAPTADPDLRSTLASGSWSERDLALDALRRSLDAGLFDLFEEQGVAELLAGVRPLAEDSDSPNQARALAVLARWPQPVELVGIDAIADHALPAVRLRLAEYLGARGGPAGQALLASLLGDPDARVSAQALRGWAATCDADSDWASVPDELFADLVQLLGAQGAPDAALASLSRAASTPTRACQVEALRLRLHGSGDVAVLASGWTAVRDARARRLLGEAARVAGVRLPALGEALFELWLAPGARDRTQLLHDAVQASDPMRLLERARAAADLSAERREQLWQQLLGREVHWEEAVVLPWLGDPDRDLRLRVVLTLSVEDAARDEGTVGRLLVHALGDASPAIAEVAFRSLAGAREPGPWFGDLHAAWLEAERPDRLRLLGYLPRRVAAPAFRADLLELAAEPAPHPNVLEVLAGLGPDPELARVLAARLEAEVTGFLDEPTPLDEQVCLGLARALSRLEEPGAAATARREELLLRTAQLSERLGKQTAASLGRTARGRVVLARHLDDARLPQRIRIEAALAIAGVGEDGGAAGDAPAVALLSREYEACDRELRSRVVAACESLTDRVSFELLRGVALGLDGRAGDLAESACWALVPRGAAAVDVLAALVESPAPVELRAAAIRALGAIASTGAPRAIGANGANGATEARTFLLEHLRQLDSGLLPEPGGPGGPEDLGELLLFERAALIESLAPLQPAPPWLAATWLRVPRAAAQEDLTSRLAGTRLPATEFRWRTELAFARAAAAAGELQGALEANEGWERIDGRCLAALGRAALATDEARSLESARSLLAAALVALAGEGRSSDLGAVVLATRRSAWLAAERAADWPATELHARRLLELRQRGEVPEVLWVAEFGVWDPVAGRDPEGRLRESLREARSRIEADPRRR